MKCIYCNKPLGVQSKCPSCGFPSAGTDEEKNIFLRTKMIVMKNDVEQATRHLRVARWLIVGVGVLSIVLLVAGFGGPDVLKSLSMYVSLGFVLLGLLFNINPVAVCTIALVAGFFIFSLSLLTIFIMVFLAIGLYFAVEARAALKKQELIRSMLDEPVE